MSNVPLGVESLLDAADGSCSGALLGVVAEELSVGAETMRRDDVADELAGGGLTFMRLSRRGLVRWGRMVTMSRFQDREVEFGKVPKLL